MTSHLLRDLERRAFRRPPVLTAGFSPVLHSVFLLCKHRSKTLDPSEGGKRFLSEEWTSEGMNGKFFSPLNILLLKYAVFYPALRLRDSQNHQPVTCRPQKSRRRQSWPRIQGLILTHVQFIPASGPPSRPSTDLVSLVEAQDIHLELGLLSARAPAVPEVQVGNISLPGPLESNLCQ